MIKINTNVDFVNHVYARVEFEYILKVNTNVVFDNFFKYES